jgi:hypothetical protein
LYLPGILRSGVLSEARSKCGSAGGIRKVRVIQDIENLGAKLQSGVCFDNCVFV